MRRPNETRIAHWSRATQAGLVLLVQALVPSFYAGLPESLICPECKPACQCKPEEKPKRKPDRPKKA